MKLTIPFLFAVISTTSFGLNKSKYYEGEKIFNEKCTRCHGINATSEEPPNLFGQNRSYLKRQLRKYKSGKRRDLLFNGAMNRIARRLSDRQIKSVSYYLNRQSSCLKIVPVNSLGGNNENGRKIARSCSSCHNFLGRRIPKLTGLKTEYLVQSLEAYKSGLRRNFFMTRVVRNMSAKDMLDVAAYYNRKGVCH